MLIGLGCSAFAIPEGLARESLVVFGMIVALVAPTQALLDGFRSKRWTDLPVAACAWATGWILWPFWINGKHRLPNEYYVFAEFPAEKVPPGIWVHKLWFAVALLGSWVAVIVSASVVLVVFGRAVTRRSVPTLDWIRIAVVLLFGLSLGRSLAHALNWILD